MWCRMGTNRAAALLMLAVMSATSGCVTVSAPAEGKPYGVELNDALSAVARGEGREALAHYEARAAGLTLSRDAYAQALLRARAHGSVEGVQRVAEAFEALGDHDASGQTLALARDMARQPRVP